MATKSKTKSFDALKWVSLAAAREDNRPILTWAHWNASNATLAAADGYKLFVARGLTPPPDSLVNESFVRLKKSSGDADGTFPDYEAIVPKSFALSVFVNPARLSEAVKRALIFARDNIDSVRLDVYPPIGLMRVSGRSNERGNCETIVETTVELGNAFSVSYNGTYLLDALTGFSDSCELHFGTGKNPLLLMGDLNDHFAIVMPMAMDRDGNTSQTPPPPPDVPTDPIERQAYFALPIVPKGDPLAAIRKRNKAARERGIGIPVGPRIRFQLSGSPEAALKQDIENALTLSAVAHGDPKIVRTVEGQNRFAIQLRSTECVFDIAPDALYGIALAWHWDRLLNRALNAPPIVRRYKPRYHSGTGPMSAFRKRARLLVA